MRWYTFLLVVFLIVLFTVVGCGHKIARDVYHEPERARTSQAAKEPCKDPVALPDKDLSEDETLYYWGLDRAELADCGAKNKVLSGAAAITERSK